MGEGAGRWGAARPSHLKHYQKRGERKEKGEKNLCHETGERDYEQSPRLDDAEWMNNSKEGVCSISWKCFEC